MNPEIRFRVPEHVHQLANRKAQDLGLHSKRGRTGGASELARCALYTFLGLGLPKTAGLLPHDGLQRVRSARDEVQAPTNATLKVTVYHRVCPEFRRKSGLNGRAVASRHATEFQFQPGELPDFLIPYVLLTDRGTPFISLNLEGPLSPRRHALGELHAASESATLDELRDSLQAIARKKNERHSERALREERTKRGTKLLQTWTQSHGSELLRARLDGNFDWLELACLEYSLHSLRKLGLEQLTHLPTTHSLESSTLRYRNSRPHEKPQLATLKALNDLKALSDEGLSLSVVLVDDSQTLTTQEAILISLALPVPGRMHFLTALSPAEPT